jgi:hypothetical protein
MLPEHESLIYKYFVELVRDCDLERMMRSLSSKDPNITRIMDNIKFASIPTLRTSAAVKPRSEVPGLCLIFARGVVVLWSKRVASINDGLQQVVDTCLGAQVHPARFCLCSVDRQKKKRSKQLHEYLKDVIGQLGKKIFLVKNVGMSTPVWIYGRTCSPPRARTGRALFVKGSGGFRRTIAATTTAASSSNC